MEKRSRIVRLTDNAGLQIDAVFSYDPDQELCQLTLRYSDKELTATEGDYFEALCTIRRQLEGIGLRPHCYGASRNVFPSGMSRDMGSGLTAYKMRIGEPARTDDLVSIFDTGPDVEPVLVEEQEQYFKEWLRSLGW